MAIATKMKYISIVQNFCRPAGTRRGRQRVHGTMGYNLHTHVAVHSDTASTADRPSGLSPFHELRNDSQSGLIQDPHFVPSIH